MVIPSTKMGTLNEKAGNGEDVMSYTLDMS